MPQRPRTPSAAAESAPGQAPEAALLAAGMLRGALPGLVAGFSTALPRLDDDGLRPLLRRLVAVHAGLAQSEIPPALLLRQTHSAHVLELDGAPGPALQPSPRADGAAATRERPRLLVVKTADCVPVLALEEGLGRYAALHAGWRGTAAGILPHLLDQWRTVGGAPERVRLELGPHIQGCCYEVQADCLERFDPEALQGAVQRRDGRTFLHLAAVLQAQAARAGIPAAQVHVSPHCTYCHRAPGGEAPYASYRRASHAGQALAATNVGLIGVLAAG
jgi:purine-nucleoside/S-methyl-5'-thioadenosine phosphorylase / adenosine deaminase